MISVLILVVSLILSAHCEKISTTTPPPPVGDNLGGTKAENIALFHQFLDAGKPEQIAAYRDDNPILKEVLKVFNQTVQTQVIGYAVHKSILTSNDKECDRIALEKADAIMKKAFGDTCECLITFRLKVRSQVNPSIMDIRQVPDDIRAALILPVDECFEKMKTDTFKQFGQNTADHIICSKKIQN